MTPKPLPPGLPPVLGAVAAALKSAFGRQLGDYAQTIGDRRAFHRPKSKVINDAIWKTIRLEPWEAVVLDSPIVQRLRHVRQLGLANLVFPTSGYSRFEHSIGVLHQTQRMIDALNHNARASGRGIEPISPNDATLLRLAALLHDVGHGFLSHVSERAMERISAFPDGGSAADAQREAQAHYECRKKPAFSEVLAAMLVQLPEFIDVLNSTEIPGWTGVDLSFRIAQLITGATPYPHRPFLSEMISGAVDADKLDYMARDCYMAGLPMPVDVERLLQKVQAVGVHSDSEPGKPWAQFARIPEGKLIYLLAVDLGGGRAVEEMLVSRLLLYDKLYKHHKVRAFEGMVENALDALAEGSESFRCPSTFLKLSDDQFLSGEWGDAKVSAELRDRVLDLVTRIWTRETVRAHAFGPALLKSDAIVWVDKKLAFLRWSDESRALKSRVAERAKQYLRKNGQADLANSLSLDLLVIDLPDAQRIAERTRFYVGNEISGLQLYSEVFGVDRWLEAYEMSRHVGYVFCPREYAVAVHLAVRDEVGEMGLEFTDGQVKFTKVDATDVHSLEQVIAGKQEERPIASPASSRASLDRDDIEARFGSQIQALAERFQPYEYSAVDAASIVAWLSQFPRDDFPHALATLQHVRFWSRPSLTSGLAHGLRLMFPQGGAIQCVPLGGATTSAVHLQYLWDDVRSGVPELELATHQSIQAIQRDVPVIFYDDYCGSGTQSRTVLMQWANRPREEWLVDERHVEPLSEDVLSILKTCPIRFVFVGGRTQGLRALLDHTKQQWQMTDVDGCIVAPCELPCFDLAAGVFARRAEAEAAKRAFESAGRSALAGNLDRWGEAKVQGRLLGYGGAADLTVFYYNTPSSTVTALWAESTIAGSEWAPLFRRRKREP